MYLYIVQFHIAFFFLFFKLKSIYWNLKSVETGFLHTHTDRHKISQKKIQHRTMLKHYFLFYTYSVYSKTPIFFCLHLTHTWISKNVRFQNVNRILRVSYLWTIVQIFKAQRSLKNAIL